MKAQQCSRYNNLRVWRCFNRYDQRPQCFRFYSTTASQYQYRPLASLEHVELDHFRQAYFIPEHPILLPRRHFQTLPALTKWFSSSPSRLNTIYLSQHGADAMVPLELTQFSTNTDIGANELDFRQFHAPLSLFLEWMSTAESLESQKTRLYLAQCQLLDLPQTLRDDLPAPDLVKQVGKGDIYDTNVWIGYPPTYTPLHRDPNPNLFVQLAGRKMVRLLPPSEGQKVFGAVRRQMGKSAGREAAAMRGDEMMQGEERFLLEKAVWHEATVGSTGPLGFEASLEAGDGMFIPRGWWHSIKGLEECVTASVNWWFR
ncbi:putative JmjC domain protein [Aspergillus saccharolyticus JOP 1030-1]|uniref:Putative JmjC domain protein n=1 Tax=Aspergillus saccharolyticus JOP 1030-1 TaxID=1450539 RepID=A0A318Z3D2_9EURO|nr:putative JmjC domain protein [Aspergillus saccharolyticus JOP 1030-1]PYH41821.1 putative JmjC domain protein [Aspergillus saccharolyticus JOP 1030-1]